VPNTLLDKYFVCCTVFRSVAMSGMVARPIGQGHLSHSPKRYSSNCGLPDALCSHARSPTRSEQIILSRPRVGILFELADCFHGMETKSK
jgi:hypothetical protein